MDELKAMVVDSISCPYSDCEYVGDKAENVARHLALYHCKLDEFLNDQELIDTKRANTLSKPKRVSCLAKAVAFRESTWCLACRQVSIGPNCVICGIKDPAREHVSRHFMKELMGIVVTLDDQLQCPDCAYR